jgi:hypothetical protein
MRCRVRRVGREAKVLIVDWSRRGRENVERETLRREMRS